MTWQLYLPFAICYVCVKRKYAVNTLSKERDEDRVKIVKLEQEVVSLQGQVQLQSSKQIMAKPGANNNVPQHNKDNPSTAESPGATGLQPGQVGKQVINPKQQQGSNGDMGHRTGPTKLYSHIINQDGHGATTVLHKNTSTLPENIAKQAIEGRHLKLAQHEFQNQQQEQETHHHNNPQELARKPKRTLRGAKHEKASALYLQQIQIDGDEADEEIGYLVKSYAAEKGIRIMNFRLIRYKKTLDTVGMRISVPESQEHIALNPGTWPNEMKCRRWEPAGVWYKKYETGNGEYRSNGYQGDSRYGDRDHDGRGEYRDNRAW